MSIRVLSQHIPRETEENMKTVGQNSGFPIRDLKAENPDYEEMLPARSHLLVFLCYNL